MTNIVALKADRADIAQLVADLRALIYTYSERITVAEAIGTLEVVKLEIFREQLEI